MSDFKTTRNHFWTRRKTIISQMNEARPLPQGRTEFYTWADRIISGALVDADVQSKYWTLANLILHLGPTESHKEDAFFIHSLRKLAANQVADTIRIEIREKRKTELEIEEKKKGAVLPDIQNESKVLPNQQV